MEELNNKLAEWVEFEMQERHGIYQPCLKDGIQYMMPPDFIGSLDACFQWLVPKLKQEMPEDEFLQFVGRMAVIVFVSETPALALCLAIERLIDAERD